MPKQRRSASVRIPFSGFYESKWDDMINEQERQHAEYEADYRQAEEGVPEHLRLDEDEISEILWRVSDYAKVQLEIAQGYVDGFATEFESETGIPLHPEWEEMTSPRFYNFETDRIFAQVPIVELYLMFRASRAEGHKTLAETIRRMFTGRSGFISHYPNDLDDWLAKPLSEWDHNELYALIRATLARCGVKENELEWLIHDYWADRGYHEWSQCVDWTKYEAAVQELRDEKAEAWKAENPDAPEPPYRCPDTLDLFSDYRPPAA